MKTIIAALSLAVIVGISASVNADLVDRGVGMIYDTVLDITWLQDANYAQTSGYDSDDRMRWNDAVSWANQLEYGGPTIWRLPTTESGYITAPDYTTNSEMGHLFYDELGGIFGTSITTTHNDNFSLFHFPADIISPQSPTPVQYSTSEDGSDPSHWYPDYAWKFSFIDGSQVLDFKTKDHYSTAVRDGDYGAPVPIPPSMLLLGTGLVGLAGARYSKKKK